MWENHKYGSVRGIERNSKVEYCDTRQIERDEQRGIQSKPKDGSNTCLLDKNPPPLSAMADKAGRLCRSALWSVICGLKEGIDIAGGMF